MSAAEGSFSWASVELMVRQLLEKQREDLEAKMDKGDAHQRANSDAVGAMIGGVNTAFQAMRDAAAELASTVKLQAKDIEALQADVKGLRGLNRRLAGGAFAVALSVFGLVLQIHYGGAG